MREPVVGPNDGRTTKMELELLNVLGVDKGVATEFTNSATWAVALWLGAGEEAFGYWREAAREEKRATRARSGGPVKPRAEGDPARLRLAARLMAEVAAGAPIAEAGLYSDLLRLTLADVDWLQVADRFLALPG